MKRVLLGFLLFGWIGCAHMERKPPPSSLRLYVLDCGEILTQDLSLFSPGVDQGKEKRFANPCYLIDHPKGRLLWDTGLTDELLTQPEGYSMMDGKFTLWVKKGLLLQLQELGFRPSDMDMIALSHFHLDHSGNAHLFPQAKWVVQKDEVEWALATDPNVSHLHAAFLTNLQRGNIVKIEGDFDLFGDGTVILMRTVGHTPGHQSLFVRLPRTGPILLTGDLYHFAENRTHRRVPSFNSSKENTLKSMDRFENFAREKKAQVWIQHDWDQNRKLAHAPHFLE